MSSTLYEADFLRWTTEQASALREAGRAGSNSPLDWENLAEEIDSLGRSQRSELHNRIATVIEHLLKLRFSPAVEPRAGWVVTIVREQGRIKRLLRESPSLRREVPAIIAEEIPEAARVAAKEMAAYGETIPSPDLMAQSVFDEAQILEIDPSDERPS